ncbi:4Fe-4S binding protein [Primorskyibacter flagellatus]|uniref:Regulator of nitric oxide reductase transcription n=1 Tax=Primorskyibacter flagellatus TaxID=1387277 RepID=A0A1W1ZFK2_9RHOB|nr:4Fe-4S binding protein [Primorskyibacter flagellatus]SMC47270.1 Regulator of nitric oxide reductase transcription [Primorskyibacter flagellatus]
MGVIRTFLAVCLWVSLALPSAADPLPRDTIAEMIVPPMSLGEQLNDKGVWQLLNSGGADAGYVFETQPMAPLPGFSGAPINMLVVLDLDGRFVDVRLISHNEPIFVSGLGEAPFHQFFEQYRGHSISEALVVGTPYGAGGGGGQLVYLDGVTKATASVRIAHESLLAATLQVAREKMQGISSGPPAFPDPDYSEDLSWKDLFDQGLIQNFHVTNAEVDAAFADTLWEDDDPEAQDAPNDAYLDLWIADLGPPSIARALLAQDSFRDLQDFMAISPDDEPILLIETARHGLVSDDFVRNTAPDRIGAEQGGFPVAMRDADLLVSLSDQVPDALQDGVAMILRTDRRLGFDPTQDWVLKVQAVREHGFFQPEMGSVSLDTTHVTDPRFYDRPGAVTRLAPWREAIHNRQSDLILLSVFLAVLLGVLAFRQSAFAALRHYTPIRLSILAVVLGFIGWWGQGQLSIVTPLGTLRSVIDGGSLGFLLYDPFSLVIWGAAILGFFLWGRGLFCGWLCPFGALQEFAHHIGRLLRLPQYDVPDWLDRPLKGLKYLVLLALIGVTLLLPSALDKAVEVEPFKTAITTFFIREWYYAGYALFWLFLGMILFKGFCRYVCPLGALMALGGALRMRRWIPRRVECGSPCQLCRVKCAYGAISKQGEIAYSECFQCLDCVTIHDDPAQCVPLILKGRSATRKPRATGHPNEVPAQ